MFKSDSIGKLLVIGTALFSTVTTVNAMALSPNEYIKKLSNDMIQDGKSSKKSIIPKIQRAISSKVFNPETVDPSLLYEEPYALTYYFPMIVFFFFNIFALFVGISLVVSNAREERNNDILEKHKLNQDHIHSQSFVLNSLEDETFNEEASQYEEFEVGDLTLALAATDDEVEIALT